MSIKKKVIVLGATGSIGKSALDVIRHDSESFTVVALAANRSEMELAALNQEFQPERSVLTERDGEQSLLTLIREVDADIVVNGISGAKGLLPSCEALSSGKDLALANKETIVMAGPIIRALAQTNNKQLIPVDSEHSAVFALLGAHHSESVSEIVLTASGGPFRTWDSKKIRKARVKQALNHPTWNMGQKITIDSASLANKGLEIIEAVRLFDIDAKQIKVVVHPQSLIHSLIRTKDGILYAQISHPDMRHPIHNALYWPKIEKTYLEPLTFDHPLVMSFEPPRYQDFPLLSLAHRCAAMGGNYPTAFNAANEIAVEAFLDETLTFGQMFDLVAEVLDDDWSAPCIEIEEVLRQDARARQKANGIRKGRK